MSSQINENCTNCTVCEPVCPTKSIIAGEKKFVIDLDSCENCKLCLAVCPVDAIENSATT